MKSAAVLTHRACPGNLPMRDIYPAVRPLTATHSNTGHSISRKLRQLCGAHRIRAIFSPRTLALPCPRHGLFAGADCPAKPAPNAPCAGPMGFFRAALIFFPSLCNRSHMALALARPLWQFAGPLQQRQAICSKPPYLDGGTGPHSSGVEHSLGKGEVESSNLSVGTIFTAKDCQKRAV